MKLSKTNHLSIILIILTVILLISFSLAWFYFPRQNNELYIFSSPFGIECEVYAANDDNGNGIPDISENSNSNELTRTQTLAAYYRTLEDAKKYNEENFESSAFQNIFIGRKLSYKIVIKNGLNSRSDVRIDVHFADLTAYFKSCVELLIADENRSDEDFFEIFGENSSRLLFQIRSRTATSYIDSDASGDFNTPNTEPQEYTDALSLWQYSKGERFFGGMDSTVMVQKNTLTEIDFSLACDLLPNELNNYLQNAVSYYFNHFSWTNPQIVDTAITKIAEKELLYVLNSDRPDSSNNKLEFNISQIIIRATQV